ncbi:MAG: hypothetical protein LKJ44_04495 [Bifidobacteriaceae bacterium]|jgi:hypothetical protein|nr:hypothetical protein [Bifidobacteriaceae bacterium]MCI1978958.1 hypothetical protein [Bifidobacteriaceae bacterium]
MDELLRVKANLKRGAEYVGGHLTVRTDGLYFHPHQFNIQIADLFINKAEIREIKKIRTLGLVPNGLQLALLNGGVVTLVVSSRAKLMQTIEDAYQL